MSHIESYCVLYKLYINLLYIAGGKKAMVTCDDPELVREPENEVSTNLLLNNDEKN